MPDEVEDPSPPVGQCTVDLVEDTAGPAGFEAEVPSAAVSDETKHAHLLAEQDSVGAVEDRVGAADAEEAESSVPSAAVSDEKQDAAGAGTQVSPAVVENSTPTTALNEAENAAVPPPSMPDEVEDPSRPAVDPCTVDLVEDTAGPAGFEAKSEDNRKPANAPASKKGIPQDVQIAEIHEKPAAATTPSQHPRERPTRRRPGKACFSLVHEFNSSPRIYSADDLSVRLHVRHGCLRDGQRAGPISIMRNERLLVACGGCSYFVSAVVDCQPPGPFEAPLDLDFRVGEEEDGLAWNDLDDDYRQEYLGSLRDAHEVLQREGDGGSWDLIKDQDVSVVYDETCRAFFVRAKIHHFSQGCLARKLNLQNSSLDERVLFGRPSKRELEFVNATNRSLTFLVLPTSCSQSACTSIVLGAEMAGIGANVEISRALKKAVLFAATECLVVTVPPRETEGHPTVGETCPFETCTLPRNTGNEARVILATIDETTISLWFSRILVERTRFAVLPNQFSAKVPPVGQREFAPRDFSLVQTAGMSNSNAPVSTVSS
ncbi:unnamed protein product [Ectocarpus fasciculatus]